MKRHDAEQHQIIQASVAPMQGLWKEFEKANKALVSGLRLTSRYHNHHGVIGGRIIFHDTKVRKIVILPVTEEEGFNELRIRWNEKTGSYTLCGASKHKSCETGLMQFLPDRDIRFILKAVVLGWSTVRLFAEIESE